MAPTTPGVGRSSSEHRVSISLLAPSDTVTAVLIYTGHCFGTGPVRMTSQSETEESTLNEGHPRAQEDFREQPVMPASRQRISVLTPFCCAPGRPLASPLSQDRQECKDTCAFSLSPTPKAHSLGPAGPIPEPTLRALPSLQPAGAPRVPPGQAPPQPPRLSLRAVPGTPSRSPQAVSGPPSPSLLTRAVPGCPQPLAPYPGLSPKPPQPGLSPPSQVPLPRHISVVVPGGESAALCACRAAALPGPRRRSMVRPEAARAGAEAARCR